VDKKKTMAETKAKPQKNTLNNKQTKKRKKTKELAK